MYFLHYYEVMIAHYLQLFDMKHDLFAKKEKKFNKVEVEYF